MGTEVDVKRQIDEDTKQGHHVIGLDPHQQLATCAAVLLVQGVVWAAGS